MSKRPATATRGRGRGRDRGADGRGGSTSAKRTKKNAERDCLLLLIDSGSSSSLTELNGKTSFQNSVNLTDWILSRKIFAESESFVNVAHFPTSHGEHVYENVQCYSDTFMKPVIAQLKWVLGIQQSQNNSDFIAALKGAMEFIKQARSDSYVDKVTIAIASNLSGEVKNVSQHELKELCESLNENNVDLLFIGDNTVEKSDIPKTTLDALEYVKEHCTSESQLFENALNKVSFFAQKPKAIRGQAFTLELGKELKIELQLYVKISEEKLKLNLMKITEDNEEVSTIREYEEVKINETKKEIDEDDLEAVPENDHENEENPQKLSRGDLIKGYHYGSSIIPFSEADKQMANVEKPGKCLQLIQFTSKYNILPHFLLSEVRYFLPSAKSDDASTALSSLVQAMINLDTVAIVRYAYNITSNPRTAVLIPKFSKTGCPVLQHFILPFNEDVRGFDFPALETLCEEDPNDFQLDTIDAYIDELMLIDKVKDESGKTQKIEKCRIRDIRNPKNQSVLMSLKRKALNMPPELSDDETKALFEMMSAPRETLERGQKVMNSIKKSFELTRVEPTKSAGIDGKSLNEIKGGGKIEKWDDMEV
uniref:Ku domain-containing protein n=1 Tax=Panagrolaimus sp. PS1159 TaxID=55785 RepID=A0AC35G9M1_9BILA